MSSAVASPLREETMIALRQWDQFRIHVRAAMVEGGFSEADLQEIVLQQAIYCGAPAAHTAMRAAHEVLDELAASRG